MNYSSTFFNWLFRKYKVISNHKAFKIFIQIFMFFCKYLNKLTFVAITVLLVSGVWKELSEFRIYIFIVKYLKIFLLKIISGRAEDYLVQEWYPRNKDLFILAAPREIYLLLRPYLKKFYLRYYVKNKGCLLSGLFFNLWEDTAEGMSRSFWWQPLYLPVYICFYSYAIVFVPPYLIYFTITQTIIFLKNYYIWAKKASWYAVIKSLLIFCFRIFLIFMTWYFWNYYVI